MIELLVRRRPVQFRRYAFTLIELLVVIAIIAVLGAMLMPALAQACSKAHLVRWVGYTNNTKRLALLAAHYTFEEGQGATFGNQAYGIDSNGCNDFFWVKMTNFQILKGTGEAHEVENI